MAFKEEIIGDCRLILGDAVELREQFDTHWAVIADPPYGINWDTDTTHFTGGKRRPGEGQKRPRVLGDTEPFNPAPWLEFTEVILWGANHFGQTLPPGTTLVWLKRFDSAFGTFLSDAEIAWHNRGRGVYCFRDLSMESQKHLREHPCQKPLPLLAWCIARTTASTILDPYMGVASTALACIKAGRTFVGCELDPHYFELACRRIEAAYRQLDLFVPAPSVVAPVQPGLFPRATEKETTP